jgi:hypothetical protein
LYIKSKNNPSKVLARVSANFDTKQKTVVLLSLIKTSTQYDFAPIVGSYLQAWADQEQISIFAPSSLGYGTSLGPRFRWQWRSVTIYRGPSTFYSDLSHLIVVDSWTSSVSGWVVKPLPAKVSKTPNLRGWRRRIFA